MKIKKLSLSQFASVAIALVISSSVWAATLPLENRLVPWGDYGTETVSFSDVYIKYVEIVDKKSTSIHRATSFRAESLRSSVFNLNSDNGYPDVGSFDGYMVISVELSSRGRVLDGSSFAVYSQDARFGTGNEAGCNKSGKKCIGQLIYGGDVSGFGWSGTEGVIEFAISNRTGWAVDNWSPGSVAVEHVLLNVAPFDIDNDLFGKDFTTVGDGFAVVVNSAP